MNNEQNINNNQTISAVESINQEMNLSKLEELRIIAKKKTILAIFISIIFLIAFIAIFKTFNGFTVVIVVAIIAVIPAMALRNYKLAFKDYFVKKSLLKTFTDLNYQPESGISSSVISELGMITMGNRYSSNDYVSGKYKNINFEQADVLIQDESTDSDGHTTVVTLFSGRWMIFDFNKTFKANFQVSTKKFRNIKKTLFSKDKYQNVKMESEEFNKMFKVRAINEHDVFYVLTPSLMEKLQTLIGNMKYPVTLCFVDNKLHVGLYNRKDSFEATSVFKKINEEKVLNSISSDIDIITKVVDELNLDNDLFRKEV